MTIDSPLRGIRVIELSSMIAGPIVGRLFGELGADVVHVEPPYGDDGRNSTTEFLGSEGVFHSMHNRSKRGLVVDIKQPDGRDVIRRLAREADVLIENMTVGTLDDLGLGYEALRAENPRLVYVSISAWGREGPLALLPGYDILIQGFTGAVQSPAPDLPPVLSPSLVGDPVAPLIAAFATLVALRDRDATGEGTHVTTSLLQAALHMRATDGMIAEGDPGVGDWGSSGVGGLAVLETADGLFVVLCAWTDEHYRRLCELADFEHGLAEQFETRLGRMEHAEALNEVFAHWVGTMDRGDLVALLRREGIPIAPVNTDPRELLRDAGLRDAGMVVPIDHPTRGRFWQFGVPFELDGRRGDVWPAPLLGEHSDDVLREYGFGDQEIADLRQSGSVA
ncbi:MAG: CoA transferase [Chloroflexi bacterium]|nr:CoA transferase [Chloroflexota bacterium]